MHHTNNQDVASREKLEGIRVENYNMRCNSNVDDKVPANSGWYAGDKTCERYYKVDCHHCWWIRCENQ